MSDTGAVSADQLKAIVARIENREEEKRETMAEIKDIYAEAKGNGFDTKALRLVIRRRRLEKQAREELDELTALYESAVGV